MRKGLLIFTVFAVMASGAHAAQAPNPRGGVDAARGSIDGAGRGTVSSAAQNIQSRATATQRDVTSRTAQTMLSARSAASPAAISARGGRVTAGMPAALALPGAALSRAGVARATSIFGDMTKMGVGYAGCYDTYNTCMDQFCAAANNTYRRCFCSDKFKEFRDTEQAISQAKNLLLQFNDNNLNVVDKTAEEVKAMYSATEGELALKKDVSASSKMLQEIADLLSGKKKATTYATSVDLTSINFMDISGIWENSDDWLATTGRNMSTLEGMELYNESNRQCTAATNNSCEGGTAGMVRSAYSILVAQDCNAYERKIAQDKETIQQTVRDAYKILRQARLEEYRAHNSADMNECITKVRNSILSDQVCGEGFKKCLDPTGLYVNATTGEPIYSSRLFNLSSLITLGNEDVVSANPSFSRNLDTKRKFAESALDTCRNIAEDVWKEFKRAAIIEIAQSQDEAVESVRMTCVSTMKDCYDSQGNQLAAFDNTSAQATGAIIAKTTSAMCRDKVQACAALFSDGSNPCQIDQIGNITNAERCGLTALWTFVDTVDAMKATEGCDVALENYIQDLCKPVGSSESYPYGCRLRTMDWLGEQLNTYAATHCIDPQTNQIIDKATQVLIPNMVAEVQELLSRQMQSSCTKYGGLWMTSADEVNTLMTSQTSAGGTAQTDSYVELEPSFLYTVYGGAEGLRNATNNGVSLGANGAGKSVITSISNIGYGVCVLNTVATQCRLQDADTGGQGHVTFNAITGECEFDEAWYRLKCEGTLTGTWNTSTKTCLYK